MFAGWERSDHPWRVLEQKFPTGAIFFDVEPFMPDARITIRADKMDRTVELWRQTH
ncbi:hypothetical protein PC128_g8978 [Phytophthora cactorum]|nr:hypothetical protein C6341_g4553 [Phytophthora cactorum]KAG3194850.1 hypothetical protein PC128_g8978 [Phytophthora cactorum]